MAGFDSNRAFMELNVPKGYCVEAAMAIGRRGNPLTLPEAPLSVNPPTLVTNLRQ